MTAQSALQSTELTVAFVDNFDSFTYNLVEYVSQHADPVVRRNTASLDELRSLDPDAIVISPGPGHPKHTRDVGVTPQVLRELTPTIPTLGVCLGLETAVYEYGGTVGRAPEPVHGKVSAISHDGHGVFTGLKQEFKAGRYHSLIATEVPDEFVVSARTADSETLVMGLRHRDHPFEAVQFHPESVLTGVGHELIENFLTTVARENGSAP